MNSYPNQHSKNISIISFKIFKLFLNTDSKTYCLPFNKCKTTFLLNGLYIVWNQQNQVVPTLWPHNMNLPLREYGEQDDVSGCPPLGLLLTVEFQRCSLQIAGKIMFLYKIHWNKHNIDEETSNRLKTQCIHIDIKLVN